MGAWGTTNRKNCSIQEFNKDRNEVIVSRNPEERLAVTLNPEEYYHIRLLYERILHNSNPNKPCVGYLSLNASTYSYISYATFHQIVLNLAKGLMKLNLPVTKDDNGKDIIVVGVMALSRYEWLILTAASWYLNITLAPLYSTLGPDAVMHIFTQTEMSLAFVGSAQKEMAASLAKKCKCKLATIVTFEDGTPGIEGFRCFSFNEIIKSGSTSNESFPLPNKDAIAQICYTSGTTGVPKGVVATHRMISRWIVGFINSKAMSIYFNRRYFSCLPMAHAYEGNLQIYFFCIGNLIGFSSGNVKKLMDELRIFKPEVTSLVPKILSRIVASVELKMNELTGIKKSLANRAIKSKLDRIRKSISNVSHILYDTIIFGKIKALTGGKLIAIHSGSAPLTQNVFEKIQLFFSARLLQGYGLTETLGAATIHSMELPDTSIGVPISTIQYKLIDIPDLNYYVKNCNNQGVPLPQGMVCVRGDSVFQRYYKNEELTKEAFKDGWFITGDVGMTNENGLLFIIDRVKSLIKLQQGEYISPERLDGVYSKSLMIAHIYIYGDPERSDVVAIISVENEAVKKWAEKQKIATDKMDEQFLNENLKMVIANELKAFAKEQNLNRWEFPRNMYITKKEFSIENNLITPTMKLKRRECAVFFKEEIKKCYEMDYMFPIEH
jgi:long-chain acyl-CoA synthetase